MKVVAGVFKSADDAEEVQRALQARGFGRDRVALLQPGNGKGQLNSVPLSGAEQPGVGKAVVGAVGAAVGAAGGLELGAIGATLPGVGSVVVTGLIGAAILGLAGAGIGSAVGGALDRAATEGLPGDEWFVYRDALRQGRSLVIALADDEGSAESVRTLLASHRAETIDAAGEQWWIGLRDAEQEHYNTQGGNFQRDEAFYKLGFQAGLRARTPAGNMTRS